MDQLEPLGAYTVTLEVGAARQPSFRSRRLNHSKAYLTATSAARLDVKPRAIMYVLQVQLPDAGNVFFLRLLPLAWVVRMQSESRTMFVAILEQLHRSTVDGCGGRKSNESHAA